MNWKFKYYNISTGMDWNGIFRDFQWFNDIQTTPQDLIWHGEGNVQTHIKFVVTELQKLPEFHKLSELNKHKLITAALFHDIGKKSTTKIETINAKQRIVAPHHAQCGEHLTREILYKKLNVPFKIREEICSLVRYHSIPTWVINDMDIDLKLINISLRCNLELLGILATADVYGRICPDSDILLENIEFFKELSKENNCYNTPKKFINNLSRYKTLNDKLYNPHTQHIPFDNSKFTVHMISGIAGAGKDIYIKHKLSNLKMVSLDHIRRKMKISPANRKANGKVYQEAKLQCKILMRTKSDFIFNATNITAELRSKWIKLFSSYGGNVIIHYIEVPYERLLNQNKYRKYNIPFEIINKMIHKLDIPYYNESLNVEYIV